MKSTKLLVYGSGIVLASLIAMAAAAGADDKTEHRKHAEWVLLEESIARASDSTPQPSEKGSGSAMEDRRPTDGSTFRVTTAVSCSMCHSG